ncbi:MAG: hypothetical protein QNJ37_10405 [Crocosphaera sp.]|nr:hypothetical protein [Crocosphaera sp.]
MSPQGGNLGDSQEFINRSVAIGVIVALTSGGIKLFFPNFPNLLH